jgi:hypothetical protein
VLSATHTITCPYCWQSVAVCLDLSEPEQQYVEDCSVCCHPIVIHYLIGEEADVTITVRAES